VVEHYRVRRATELIQRKYSDESVGLEDVAHAMGVSTFHACRLLKSATGRSFRSLLHEKRIAAAAVLLEETSMSIKEVAAATGYSHSNQLIRHFRIECGVTPLQYRLRRTARDVNES
jgi:AraC-like DNA-binding protein